MLSMTIRKNTKNRTHFVYDRYGSVETFISTPVKKSKRKTLLTIRSGKTRLDLNGRQVLTLKRLLYKADQLSSH